ncbi:purine nucleosidase [Microbacterium halimionae]|uniref:Purine nucleosidase n=1 Tax=Microbacterium halimionae TaxID=1526413 RepID=A0A7W3PMC0_9MICO|nr:nucleoside hydrolase [Microbacterium halimionae]MBA8817455.1 purine nucleosidase [Microbacterium halimionae]NII95102.1 purine nucleosidase [Microbacterium halimionae]
MTGGSLPERIPLVIDTDTAQDDCVALLLGLLDPAADLKAITMVAGNVGFDQQTTNAELTLAMAGRTGDVPIHLGCRRPLVREWISAEEVHGDGTGGVELHTETSGVDAEHAVDALIRLAAEEPGTLRIVCIGPLTNIATALVKDPDFVNNVGALFIMGGSNNGRGNITAAAEYNFYVDPEAAKAVFAAGFDDITVVPWHPLSLEDAVFSREQADEIERIGTPLARFFTRIIATTREFDESVGIAGSTHPDSLTAAVLLHPELVLAASNYAVDIETGSELTRGYSAMSWGVHGLSANARVIEKADAAGFFRLITQMLALDIAPSGTVTGL